MVFHYLNFLSHYSFFFVFSYILLINYFPKSAIKPRYCCIIIYDNNSIMNALCGGDLCGCSYNKNAVNHTYYNIMYL